MSVVTQQPSGRNSAFLILLSAGYIAVRVNIHGFVSMLPLVRQEFTISAAQAGLYTSFYFLSATIVAVISGHFVDRHGSRKGMAAGAALVGAMMLLHAVSPAYGVILALAFVTGGGFSVMTPSVSRGVRANIRPAGRAVALGGVLALGGLGALSGAAIMPWVGEAIGWRSTIAIGGAFAILLSVLIAVFYGRFAADEAPGDEAHSGSLFHNMGTVLRTAEMPTLCSLGVVFGLTVSSMTSHLGLFANQDLGFSPAVSGFVLSSFHVGGMIGQPASGHLNHRFLKGHRKAGLLILASVSSLLSLAFLWATSGHWSGALVFPLAVVSGFTVFGMQSIYFATVADLAPPHLTGVATGVALLFSRGAIVVGAPLFGILADATGNYRASWIALSVAIALSTAAVAVGSHLHGAHTRARDRVGPQ